MISLAMPKFDRNTENPPFGKLLGESATFAV